MANKRAAKMETCELCGNLTANLASECCGQVVCGSCPCFCLTLTDDGDELPIGLYWVRRPGGDWVIAEWHGDIWRIGKHLIAKLEAKDSIPIMAVVKLAGKVV